MDVDYQRRKELAEFNMRREESEEAFQTSKEKTNEKGEEK
jgi:hypothetical protein